MTDFSHLLVIHPPATLDEKKRCCGRKPFVYRRRKILFCAKCDREYDIDTRTQLPNFFWLQRGNGFRLSDVCIRAAIAMEMWKSMGPDRAQDFAARFIAAAYRDGSLT